MNSGMLNASREHVKYLLARLRVGLSVQAADSIANNEEQRENDVCLPCETSPSLVGKESDARHALFPLVQD